MSYTPTIIIDYDDLKEKENEIISNYKDYDNFNPYEELERNLKYEPVVFKGIKLCLIYNDLSSYNRLIREALDELEIPYSLDN